MAVVKGTTQECFRHYARNILKGDLELRRLAARYFDVDLGSIRRWVEECEKKLPYGENLIALRHLLEFAGYDVAELHDLSEPVRSVARLVAFGVVKTDTVIELCGFEKNTYLRVFTGRSETVKLREERLETFFEKHGKDLPAAKAKFDALRVANERTGLSSAHPEGGFALKPRDSLSNQELLEVLAAQTRAMIPIVEVVLSDRFTAEERRQLHKQAGGERVFKLSTALARICSEKARELDVKYREGE